MNQRQQERPLHHPPPPPYPFAQPQTAQPPVQIPFSDPFQTSRDPFFPGGYAGRESFGGPQRAWPPIQGTFDWTLFNRTTPAWMEHIRPDMEHQGNMRQPRWNHDEHRPVLHGQLTAHPEALEVTAQVAGAT
ncbi:hypothetical protein B0A55_01269 [Friedmanniomyces simplex]|uniref:Uncharacterized protein n=1 Tax=Friedmanniomyces simplex TaxID=329884 RepID=A0A4U0Y592_9PEZI|nr:hypothetical protein B0A55_01269 [Friedmanniomyces simplex]